MGIPDASSLTPSTASTERDEMRRLITAAAGVIAMIFAVSSSTNAGETSSVPVFVRYLTDADYHQQVALASRFTVVELFRGAPPSTDAKFLNVIGEQTDLMQVCRVDLAKNPKLAVEAKDGGKLSVGQCTSGPAYLDPPRLLVTFRDKTLACAK